jgi:predicted MFS family arabinose efflux permease
VTATLRPSTADSSAGALDSHRGYVLAALLVVYTLNFVDRQIIGILAVPIKADLGLTDSQLGLMGGLAFALFYTVLGIPIARLADRTNRVWIITVALGTWSLMTALCGLAQSFGQLFLARVGVGVGESGGVSPSYSLICDYFPQASRARALGVYSFGIPLGSAIGIMAGGYISTVMNWRTAFFVVGMAGLVLTPLFRLTVREPIRGRLDDTGFVAAQSLRDVLSFLARKPAFWALSAGTATASMMSYGLLFWLPSFFVRSFGLPVLEAATAFAALTLVGGTCGIWFGGVLADRYGTNRKRVYGLIPAVALLGAVPFYVAGVSCDNLWLSVVLMLIPTALGLAWMGPVLSAIQHLVPANMRSTASAIFLFLNSLIGIGLGSLVIGVLSDSMRASFGDQSLRYAILSGLGIYVVAATLFFWASRRLEQDWER